MSTEVGELLAALRNGTLTLDEVTHRFRERTWPDQTTTPPRTYLELAAAAQQDPEPDVPGSFDEVTAAYDRGELSRAEYRALAEAAAESTNDKAAGQSEESPDEAQPR
jgi:hypothetical protein